MSGEDQEDRFGDNGPIVSAAWLQDHLEQADVRVLDVRPPFQYMLGHLPGAIQTVLPALRLRHSSTDAVSRFDAALQAELRRIGMRPGERVIFYEDISGTNAARCVWLLDYAGHGGGALLDGGVSAWRSIGGALTRAVPTVTPSEIEVVPERDPSTSVLADADEILAALRDPRRPATLLDTRGDEEHQTGTIPGSVHVDWERHLTEDGRMRPLAALRRLYGGSGIEPTEGSPIITYCGSGYRAAHAYLVLRALGYPRVKNYAPSWGEWGGRPDLPIEVPRESPAATAEGG